MLGEGLEKRSDDFAAEVAAQTEAAAKKAAEAKPAEEAKPVEEKKAEAESGTSVSQIPEFLSSKLQTKPTSCGAKLILIYIWLCKSQHCFQIYFHCVFCRCCLTTIKKMGKKLNPPPRGGEGACWVSDMSEQPML